MISVALLCPDSACTTSSVNVFPVVACVMVIVPVRAFPVFAVHVMVMVFVVPLVVCDVVTHDKDSVMEMAMSDEKVKEAVEGKNILKQIYVPNKLVNIVAK